MSSIYTLVLGLMFAPFAAVLVHDRGLEGGAHRTDGAAITVSLLTVGPGPATWEIFGHNAFWVRDESSGEERLYSYGLFDWRQERFLLRFVQGRMLYRAGAVEVSRIDSYIADDRSVWVQQLDLSPEQKTELRRLLEWNVRPENADYAYDYYRDNCSTRVRDVLDRVLGGAIRRQLGKVRGQTYRYHTLRVIGDDPVLHAALSIALGQPVDRPASAWDEMFLPELLQRHLRQVRVERLDGASRPLVKSERALFVGTRGPVPEAPPSWRPVYALVGSVLAGLMLALAAAAGRRAARVAFIFIGVMYAMLAGILGSVLAAAWAFTDHALAFPNENLFLFNPLWLLLAGLLTAASVWSRPLVAPLRWLAASVGVLSLLGFVLQALPGLDQVNGDVYALALAPNVALSIGTWWIGERRDWQVFAPAVSVKAASFRG